ncbi:hypothetical protein QBC44DRAFT_394425 [Cladorrhinum sp. PSN332]|nr:hypothetical protein QBC44DRAFT_394425 [Cladorrhinum sp. PSN332]
MATSTPKTAVILEVVPFSSDTVDRPAVRKRQTEGSITTVYIPQPTTVFLPTTIFVPTTVATSVALRRTRTEQTAIPATVTKDTTIWSTRTQILTEPVTRWITYAATIINTYTETIIATPAASERLALSAASTSGVVTFTITGIISAKKSVVTILPSMQTITTTEISGNVSSIRAITGTAPLHTVISDIPAQTSTLVAETTVRDVSSLFPLAVFTTKEGSVLTSTTNPPPSTLLR